MSEKTKIKLKDCGSLLRYCAIESRMAESGMIYFEVDDFLNGLEDGTITKESWERFEQDIKKYGLVERDSGVIELHTDFDSFHDDKDNIDCVFTCYMDFEKHFEYENKVNERFPNQEFRKIIVERLLNRHDGTTDIFESDLEVLKKIESLNLEKHHLTDIKGIEYFESLRKLDISHNPITELDVSDLLGLQKLYAYECNLVDIQLPQSETLETLDVTSNKLDFLNLRNQSVLSSLSCSGNELSHLNLSECPCLEELLCSNNFISDLDLTNNVVLKYLECENNEELTSIYIHDISKLENYNVDVKLHSEKNINHLFPDKNFRKAILEDIFNLHNQSDITSEQLDVIKEQKRLLIANSKIKDLTGIEEFKNLQVLDVSLNPIKELDVSKIDTLKRVYAMCCNLHEINLPNENVTKLTSLDVTNNRLTVLDLDGQSCLTQISASNNELECIQLKECEDLQFVALNNNHLKEIDLSDCYNLLSIECDRNHIKSLNFENNEDLLLISCNANQLVKLDVSPCHQLESLSCDNNWIEELNIKGLTELKEISCDNNIKELSELLNDNEMKHKKRIIRKIDKDNELAK